MPPKARPELDPGTASGRPWLRFCNRLGDCPFPVTWISALAAERKSKPFEGAMVPRAFYDRDPRLVGPDLLGKILVRRHHRGLLVGRIVEVEAYLGAEDPAAHASAGRTARNA